MLKCTLLSVGRLKIQPWKDAVESYRKKLRQGCKITEIQVKDGDPALPLPERKRQEGQRLLEALSSLPAGAFHICLDERGEGFTSRGLADLLEKCAQESRLPCFVIGGAYGFDPPVPAAAHKKISLSPLTFTHELAQVILWEQLYRAHSILRGSGYHHE